jgi:hypothetical protein
MKSELEWLTDTEYKFRYLVDRSVEWAALMKDCGADQVIISKLVSRADTFEMAADVLKMRLEDLVQ